MKKNPAFLVLRIWVALALLFGGLPFQSVQAAANQPKVPVSNSPLAPNWAGPMAPSGVACPSTVAGYSESFTGSSVKADWKFGGTSPTTLPVLTSGSPDPVNNGWLRLTNLTGYTASYAYYDCPIPTGRGLVLEFDYAVWGGTGADGLAFFLFDGATTNFVVGASGGSLGYAQKSGVNGLTGGYLGLGLDEFGNYSNPNEGRVGGPGLRPDAIAIRGPGSGTAATANNYAYLAGTATLAASIDCPSSPCSVRPDQTGQYYRHVKITLTPVGFTYQVSASITFGGSSVTPVTYSIPAYTMATTAPATLKMGFAGSTGGNTNYHEIRNLTVNPSTPDVTALKSVTNVAGGNVHAGDTLQYTVTLINQTTSQISGLSFNDPIPPNTTYVAGSAVVPAGATASYVASPATLNVYNPHSTS